MTRLRPEDRQPGSGMAFRALDHRFTVQTTDVAVARVLDGLLGALADGGCDGSPVTRYTLSSQRLDGGPRFTLRAGEDLLASTPQLDTAIDHLIWRVNQGAIAGARNSVCVHAAAAEHAGAALLLPGESGAGKTTLVAALVARGMRYLGDEVAAIDRSSLVVRPFAKPLSVKNGSWPTGPHHLPRLATGTTGLPEVCQVDPRRIRPDALGAAAAASWIVLPEHRPGAATELETLPPAETVMALARHTFARARLGHDGLTVLAAVVARSSCHRLVFDDLAEACDTVLDLVARLPAAGAARVDDALAELVGAPSGDGRTAVAPVVDGSAADTPPGTHGAGSGPARRSDLATVVVDGQAVVLDERDGALHLLEPMAALVWGLLDGARALDELASELAAAFAESMPVVRRDLVRFAQDLGRRGLLAGVGSDTRAGPAVGVAAGRHAGCAPDAMQARG